MWPGVEGWYWKWVAVDGFERFGDRINKTYGDRFGWVTRENRRNQAELLVFWWVTGL